jgi:hypothetical protein
MEPISAEERKEWEDEGKLLLKALGYVVNQTLINLVGEEHAKKASFAVAVKGLGGTTLLTCTPEWAPTFVTDILDVEKRLGALTSAHGKSHLVGEPLPKGNA